MQRFTPPIIIDEIQYAPEILPNIKMSVDSSKRNGDFWLIGSQVFQTMNNVSDSLSGRVGIIELLGLSILVSSNIIALVQPYSNNILKRVTKMPLLHFLDTGLCAYLLKWGNAETLERGAMSGAFFESYVFSEIYKSWLNAGKVPPVCYYRDKDQRKIDLLILQDGVLYPIEVKKSASPATNSIKHFKILRPLSDPEKFGELAQLKINIGTGAVICMANDLLPIDKTNWNVPAWMI